jgi:hypothetical protein
MVEMPALPRTLTRDTLRRIAISLVVAGALVGLAVGFSGAERPEEHVQPGVERIYPTPGDLDLRQVKIGAILQPGYTGALILDGAEIPESDLYREPSLYQIELRPEKGSVFADLKPGRHCASIEFWRSSQSRQASSSQQWCFNLH